MKAIVSLRQGEAFAEVGMNSRTVIGPYKQAWRVEKHARAFANGRQARLEWFSDAPGALLRDALKVTFLGGQ
jgi:hypothetical protein